MLGSVILYNLKPIKMKLKNIFILMFFLGVAAFIACKKNEVTSFTKVSIPTSSPIAAGNIGGFTKGTLQAGNVYTITSDLTVKKGDTLSAQPGAIVIVKNNAQINIQGVLNLLGSRAQPIFFNSDSNKPGSWGGFQCDTAQAVTIKWAHVDNTGGPDASGSARRSIYVNAPINVDIEDSWFSNGQDDFMGLNHAHVTILRNTVSSSGSTDGEGINLKSGVTGTVAYNVIFSQAGSGIKLETNKNAPFPQTVVDVYNNTLVSNGWRRGAAEPGRGVSIGLNAIGHVYNNIIVNCYQGIEIFSDADIAHTTYGNNLFYASVVSYNDNTTKPPIVIDLRANFYPNDGVGKPQATDLISKSIGNFDPMFVSFTNVVASPNGAPYTFDLHLQNGSPAFGVGNPSFNLDLGAYTTDGKGNQH